MAQGVNKVIILGNLGADPELRYTPGGQPVARLNVATSRRYRKGEETVEETEWHRITVWGKQAEHCNTYLTKGRQVYVEGRLRTLSTKDGQRHYSTEIVADTVQFIGGRGEERDDGERSGGDRRSGGGQRRSSGKPPRDDSPPYEDSYSPRDPGDDDIPF